MGRVAVKIGADTFQYFTRNPRGGSVKELNVADIGNFMAFRKEHNLAMPLAHAPYTLNPCAAKPDVRRFAVETMKDDLGRLEYLPGSCYNFHPGSHVGQGAQEGIRKIAEVLNEVIRPEQKTTVLLETMAGKGSEVGRTFEELRSILDQVDPELAGHIGICMDTCHVWDSGYDIAGDLDGVLKKFDRTVGLERLKAIHLNDSKNPLGAHKDRHEKLGKGCIGLPALLRVVSHPDLKDLPFYLEIPNELNGYEKEISLLRRAYENPACSADTVIPEGTGENPSRAEMEQLSERAVSDPADQ